MAEAAKVRLVRCPKCENLLPELPDFSLYQCGGCGAVLKAKQKRVLEDGLTDNSDDVKGLEIPDESNIVEASEVKMDNFAAGILEEAHEGATCNDSSTSRAESTEAQFDSNLIRSGKERIRNFKSNNTEYSPYSQGLVHNRNLPINHGQDVYDPDYVYFSDKNVKDKMPPMEPLRSRPVPDQCRPARGITSQMRIGDFRYFDEGQSSYETDPYNGRGERIGRYWGPRPGGPSQMEELEKGRAELIRKLDELKDQISRSCDMSDKSNEMISKDQKAVPSTSPDPYSRRLLAYNHPENLNKQPLAINDVGPPYFANPHEYIPYTTDRYRPGPLGPYLERRHPHEFMHYSGSYKPEILRGPPYGPHSRYVQHHPYHGPGYYGDVNNHNPCTLNCHENFFHQPSCSCMHCCDKSWPGLPTTNHPGTHNPRFHNETSNNPNHRPLGNNGNRGSNLRALYPQKSLSMNSNDVDSENDGLNHHRPIKFVVGHKSGWRASHPVAGGAPLIGCSNCFEVLKIPRRWVLSGESQQKLKCGACSSIIVFELGEKGFNASVHVDQVQTEMDESSGALDENVRYPNGGSNLNAYSNEYDNFQDQFSPDDKKTNSLTSEKQLDQLSSASSLSEDDRSLENEVQAVTDVKSLQDQDLPTDKNIGVNRFDQRNKSQRPEQEKVSLERALSQQKSVKDADVATEMDVSLNEFSTSCVSHDSVEISKEAKPKANKGGESFFAGLIKKSFHDFKKPSQGVEASGQQVSVNGHFIPDCVAKRAEKLAGPIQPGEYWYDKCAGFWGVMGHPCLGIIMPNIEEFDYPMPDNCAAGNTGVFVNGRELHQKDLDLLASRGLPITRNRYYRVEITGRVVDEQTGEELDGLGKLAPTVERAKHGFGMKVPRFIAQSKN